MGFAVMSMTEAAAARVKTIVENSGPDAMGIRVGIKKGGCAGMEYTVSLVTEANPKDDLIERDGAVIGFSASTALADALGVYVKYEGTISGQDSSHAIAAGLRMTW